MQPAMQDDTDIGGRSPRFPVTRWSVLLAARSEDPAQRTRAFETIVSGYWKPVYKYIRIRWNKSNEDAKDLTQEFFARVIEKDFLANYDPAAARLRTFLRVCVDRFLSNQEKSARRLKRGGDAVMLPLEFESAEAELACGAHAATLSTPAAMEDYFEKEWLRHLFSLSLDALRLQLTADGKLIYFRLFERYDLEEEDAARPTYAQLAREFGVTATAVTNYLACARREFRRTVLEKLRDMSATENEFRREARAVLGIDPL
ncbi:MAG: sigma-70 family RNA polymerase sigma factor [Acidipila sp.]|nr:sigma-70 family RNA polymerase sigma factor [Acidipila sp.]